MRIYSNFNTGKNYNKIVISARTIGIIVCCSLLSMLFLMSCISYRSQLDEKNAPNRSLLYGKITFENLDEYLQRVEFYAMDDMTKFGAAPVRYKIIDKKIFIAELVDPGKYYLLQIMSNKAHYFQSVFPDEEKAFEVKPKTLLYMDSKVIGSKTEGFWYQTVKISQDKKSNREELLDKILTNVEGTFWHDIITNCLNADKETGEK